jgi:Rieske Fe-S protein
MSEVGQADGREMNECSTRRDVLAALSAFGAAGVQPSPAAVEPDSRRPRQGDLFVAQRAPCRSSQRIFRSAARRSLRGCTPPPATWSASDLAQQGAAAARSGEARKRRTAEGIVADSAVCPHAGCEVSVWVADQQIFECFCHYLHFNPRAAAAVLDGPAPRALAALPLKMVDNNLAVAKPFIGRVGILPT